MGGFCGSVLFLELLFKGKKKEKRKEKASFLLITLRVKTITDTLPERY